MENVLRKFYDLVWGIPALILILAVGLLLTLRTRFGQFRMLPEAMGRFFRMLTGREGKSSFRSLCTALGATVGTGNLVGVAGAICLGGPGSIFWMWICGFLGMATKYAEVVLAMRYRVREKGSYLGGPMYVIEEGLGKKWKPLAVCYCFFGAAAAFGVGNATQINAVISSVNALGIGGGPRENLLLGLILAAAVGLMLRGGSDGIGRIAERLVPLAAGGYILACLAALLVRARYLPGAFGAILAGAFRPEAVTGGLLGSMVCSLRVGCARGVFTNEAGMGTASIAHACAEGVDPVQQGMMGIVEVFLDTILICTLTALVILTSGVQIPYGADVGALLTTRAFSLSLGGWTQTFLTMAIVCFAFATVLGWGLYGLRCIRYLLGEEGEKWFLRLQVGAVVLGAVLNTGVVWILAEIMNGLMAIPNLLALALLSREVGELTPGIRRKAGE